MNTWPFVLIFLSKSKRYYRLHIQWIIFTTKNCKILWWKVTLTGQVNFKCKSNSPDSFQTLFIFEICLLFTLFQTNLNHFWRHMLKYLSHKLTQHCLTKYHQIWYDKWHQNILGIDLLEVLQVCSRLFKIVQHCILSDNFR